MRWNPFKRSAKAPKKKRAYQGAQFGRTTANWLSSSTSADSEISMGISALRARAQQMGRDSDHVKGYFRLVQNNIVGCGIDFQAQVKMQRGKGKLDDSVNEAIEAAWKRWTRKDSADTAGKLSFQEIQRLAVRQVAENGEWFGRIVTQKMGRSKVPLAIESIESNMCDETYNDVFQNGNVVKMGVELNSWKRPVAYWFFTNHPGDSVSPIHEARKRVRVPASEVIHLFIQERAGQTRGVTWLASAIMKMHHLDGMTQAEVVGARAASSLMGFIESAEEQSSLEDENVDGEVVTDFEPGTIKKLFPGEKINVPNIARPNGQFEPFTRAMLRGVATGLGVSYESFSKDYSQSNYSSSRLALLDDRDNWKPLQNWIISNLCQPVFERFLDLAVLSGELSLKGYEVNPEYFSGVKWQPRGWSWIDPAKEVSAFKDAVRSGFMTQSDVISQTGGDYDELMTKRKSEVEKAEEYGLIFDTDPEAVSVAGLSNESAPAPKSEPATKEPSSNGGE